MSGKQTTLYTYGPEFGYSLASGRLFCDFALFQEWTSDLVGRPLMTHHFADARVWDEIREAFEADTSRSGSVPDGRPETTRPKDACGLCGRNPAAGYAKLGEVRYCHGDEDPEPTCYMQAQRLPGAIELQGYAVRIAEADAKFWRGMARLWKAIARG